MSFIIESIPAFKDNYSFIIGDKDLGLAVAVDPSDGEAILNVLNKQDLFLALILNTHHHANHVTGNEKLYQEFGAPIIAPAKEQNRIPNVARGVGDGDIVSFSTLRATVIETSGHTMGHVSYYFPQIDALFSGDALFSLGCGKPSGGDPVRAWESIKKLRELPNETLVYFGHECSEDNAKLALMLDKDNPDLQRIAEKISIARAKGQPTVPTTIGEQKLANPFMRVDDKAFRENLQKLSFAPADAEPAAVFGKLCLARAKLTYPDPV